MELNNNQNYKTMTADTFTEKKLVKLPTRKRLVETVVVNKQMIKTELNNILGSAEPRGSANSLLGSLKML